MISFEYEIKDEIGLHARPAGNLAKTAREWKSEITVKKGEKEVLATKLMALMSLCIKKGDVITVTVSGEDEKEAKDAISRFLKENL